MMQGHEDTQAPVPQDHPMMKAWEAYKDGPHFANTLHWAMHVEIARRDEDGVLVAHVPHAQGQLWAAFVAGWNLCEQQEPSALDLGAAVRQAGLAGP